jgi:threonine synthase
VRPQLPAALADLYERPERFSVLDNDIAALKSHIRGQVAAGRAA